MRRRLHEGDINRIVNKILFEEEQSSKPNPCFKNVSFSLPSSCKKFQGPVVGTTGAMKCMTDLTSKLVSDFANAGPILKAIGCMAKHARA
jgi:hypothetical protein